MKPKPIPRPNDSPPLGHPAGAPYVRLPGYPSAEPALGVPQLGQYGNPTGHPDAADTSPPFPAPGDRLRPAARFSTVDCAHPKQVDLPARDSASTGWHLAAQRGTERFNPWVKFRRPYLPRPCFPRVKKSVPPPPHAAVSS